jgi:hypothetical protein
MPDKQSITQAAMDGIQVGYAAVASAQENHKRNIGKSFNIASGVLEGMNILREIAGTSFEYSTKVNNDGSITISTNIPAHNTSDRLEIYARPDGEIAAYGTCFAGFSDDLSVDGAQTGASEKIVAFVAERAAKNGLVKPIPPSINKMRA